jgi:hypothetical protein
MTTTCHNLPPGLWHWLPPSATHNESPMLRPCIRFFLVYTKQNGGSSDGILENTTRSSSPHPSAASDASWASWDQPGNKEKLGHAVNTHRYPSDDLSSSPAPDNTSAVAQNGVAQVLSTRSETCPNWVPFCRIISTSSMMDSIATLIEQAEEPANSVAFPTAGMASNSSKTFKAFATIKFAHYPSSDRQTGGALLE